MKIATLLTQYLYNNKRLDLPGIGTFLLDASALEAFELSKVRAAAPDGISFESKPTVKESPELIAYISSESGKMKALASADLESYIQLAQQFLNIGKPFIFEGIGTLVLAKQGEFQFTPLPVISEKNKDFKQKEAGKTSSKEETKRYQSFLDNPTPSSSMRKPVIALLIVCGLGLAILGGYAISKKSAPSKTDDSATQTSIPAEPIVPAVVDSSTIKKPDTQQVQQAIAMNSSNYKYVLEVTNGKRALKRFNQLKTNLWDVKIETSDSVKYKLYSCFLQSARTLLVY